MEEQLRILKMVEDGKITAEQAAALLGALKDGSSERGNDIIMPNDLPYNKRMLYIRINTVTGDNIKLQFPVPAIHNIIRITGTIPGINESVHGANFNFKEMLGSIADCLDAQTTGDIVNVTASDGTSIKIFVA